MKQLARICNTCKGAHESPDAFLICKERHSRKPKVFLAKAKAAMAKANSPRTHELPTLR